MITSALNSCARAAFVMVLILAAAASPRAAAQGFDDFIVEPLTSERFDAEIERLDLTWGQRIAAEQAHEIYKEKVFHLLEHDVRDMMRKLYEMEGGNFRLPDRKQILDLLKARDEVTAKIRSLDRALFDTIQQDLREGQPAQLERLRRSRERQSYELDMFSMGSFDGATPNLTTIIETMKLDPEIRSQIEPALVEYERSINRGLKEVHDATFDMILKLFDIMEEMGFGEDMDEADMMRMAMAMQEALNRASGDLVKAQKNVAEISNSAQKRIAALLPASNRARFDLEYKKIVYEDVFNDHSSVESTFEATLKSEDLSADARSRLEAMRSSWQRRYDEINKQMMANVDERREKQTGPFDFGGGSQEFWQKHQELEAERQQLNQTTREQLLAAIDLEVRERVEHVTGPAAEYDELYKQAYGADAEAMVIAEGTIDPSIVARGVDQSIPGAISREEFAGYAHRMGMTRGEITIAQAVLDQYSDGYQELSAELNEMLAKPRERIHAADAMERDWAALPEIRREALVRVLALEDAFFTDVAALLSKEQLERLPDIRTARKRVVYDLGQSAGMYWEDDYVDLVRVIDRIDLPAEALYAVHPRLAELEAALLPIVEQQYQSVLEHELAQLRASRMMVDWERDPQGAAQSWQEYQKAMRPFEERLRTLMEERTKIEQEATAGLIAALPAPYAQQFQKELNKYRYPEIWPDHENAENIFPHVLALRSLSAGQRDELEIIMSDHHHLHDDLSTQMMKLADEGTDFPDFSGGDRDEMRDWQQRQLNQGILQFRRGELNSTTRRRIRAILAQDQAAQVRGLGVAKRG